MKLTKKLFGTALALVLAFSCMTGIVATAGEPLQEDVLLGVDFESAFTHGVYSTGEVVATKGRSGQSSYKLTVGEGDTATKFFSVPLTKDFVENTMYGKNLVAEIYYSFGEIKPAANTSLYLGFNWCNGGSYGHFSYEEAPSGTKYDRFNEVKVDTNPEGWYRMRTAIKVMRNDFTWSNNLLIDLKNAPVGLELYVDDVRLFETDNLLDMVTDGNADFNTFDNSAKIDGDWTYWLCNGANATYDNGTVSVVKDHSKDGGYALKFVNKLNSKGTSGGNGIVSPSINFCDFVPAGTKLATEINFYGNRNGVAWNKLSFKITSPLTGMEINPDYGEPQYKTAITPMGTVAANSVGNFELMRTDGYVGDPMNELYVDSIRVRIIPDADLCFAGFKKTDTANGNITDMCYTVDTLSHGDVVYPYVYFKEAKTTPTSVIVARYRMENGVKVLDELSIQKFDTYTAQKFEEAESIATTGITVPESGEYTYKLMVWESSSISPIIRNMEYVVK